MVMPTGRPPRPKPQGTEIAGSPHSVDIPPTGSDHSTSARLLSAGGAVIISAGATTRSQREKKSAIARWHSVRMRSALTYSPAVIALAAAFEIVASGSASCRARPSRNSSSNADAASALITSAATASKGSSGSFVSATVRPALPSTSTASSNAPATSFSTALGSGRMMATFSARAPSTASGAGTGSSADQSSCGSWPAMTRSTASQSSAERASGPSLSIVQESAMAPWRDTRPNVGRTPLMPQKLAGQMMEPQVSEPSAKATRPAATDAPEPDDDPQLHFPVSHGLRVAPVKEAQGTL